VMSYMRAGRNADAKALVERGMRESGRFAPVYRRMAAEIGKVPAQTAPAR
jgi:hypothetical protein